MGLHKKSSSQRIVIIWTVWHFPENPYSWGLTSLTWLSAHSLWIAFSLRHLSKGQSSLRCWQQLGQGGANPNILKGKARELDIHKRLWKSLTFSWGSRKKNLRSLYLHLWLTRGFAQVETKAKGRPGYCLLEHWRYTPAHT